jgi:hypothetical protein
MTRSKYPIVRALVDAEKALRKQGRMGHAGEIKAYDGICCAVGILAKDHVEPYVDVEDRYGLGYAGCSPLWMIHDAVVEKYGEGNKGLDAFTRSVKKFKKNPKKAMSALYDGDFTIPEPKETK